MFGYIRPYKEELKLKDYNFYRGFYCALCTEMGKQLGAIYRCIITYDVTFLLICLDSISNYKNKPNIRGRCPGNLQKKFNVPIDPQLLEYAAFLNYYLFQRKVLDNVEDVNNIIARKFFEIMHKILNANKNFKRWKKANSEHVHNLDVRFQRLAEEEKNGKPFDVITNLFGEVTKYFVVGIEHRFYDFCNNDERINCQLKAIKELFFNLGKWAYLIDALDDYNDDVKKGRFNLINTMQGDVSDKLQKEHIEKCCVIVRLIQFKIMTSCESILENEIIKNIVFYGIENVTSNVLRNTQKFRKK